MKNYQHSSKEEILHDLLALQQQYTLLEETHKKEIDELRRTENDLRESEEKYRMLFNANRDSISIIELDDKGNPSGFLELNEAASEIIGYTREELLATKLKDIEVEVPQSVLMERINQLQTTGSVDFETTIKDKTGNNKYIDVKVVLITYKNKPALLNISRDITEFKKTEKGLFKNASRLELAMHSAKMAWWEMDMPSGNVTFSKRKTDMLGYKYEDFTHFKDFMALVHPEDAMTAMNAMYNHFAGKVDKYEVEYRILTKSGEYKWFYDLGSTVKKSSDGKPLKVTGLVIDVSERKQIDLIIKDQNKELIKLNSDKDRFISILAHDLRNPFSAFLGLTGLLSENIRKYDIDKTETFINIINQRAQNIFDLLDELLLWTSVQSGKLPFKPQKIDLSKVCNEVIELLEINAKIKDIGITNHIVDQTNLFVDLNMIKTVLRNLISNAIKFTNEKGHIAIQAKSNESIITITISDDGTGINPQDISKLFDISQMFTSRGTADEQGSGLGLLLCKEFVVKHGGTIWVESEVGTGSDFKFTIPLLND